MCAGDGVVDQVQARLAEEVAAFVEQEKPDLPRLGPPPGPVLSTHLPQIFDGSGQLPPVSALCPAPTPSLSSPLPNPLSAPSPWACGRRAGDRA